MESKASRACTAGSLIFQRPTQSRRRALRRTAPGQKAQFDMTVLTFVSRRGAARQ